MKDDLSQENTWKHDIFFKCSEKIAFRKKIIPEHELFRTIRKDEISFSRKYNIFSRRKVKDDLSQRIRGNMMFSVYSVKIVPLFPTNKKLTFQKPVKNQRLSSPEKKTLKNDISSITKKDDAHPRKDDIGILDLHCRKSSNDSLYCYGR